MHQSHLRYVLALSREGSVRASALTLGVSHSTVARRIEAFEARLGVRLFDRTPSGYAATAAGEEMIAVALRVEDETDTLERSILGQDARLAGSISLTVTDSLVADLLMPDVAAFTASYPDIDMEIIHSYRTFDLSKREADIAIRFVRVGTKPPEHLIGRRVATSYSANYASAPFLERMDETADPPIGQWIGWEDQVRFPKWVLESDHPRLPLRSRMPDVVMQLRAANNGMGIAVLPCFVGDAQSDLLRVPPTEPYAGFDIWILSHPDLRETARLRAFREFLGKTIAKHTDLFEGRRPYGTAR